MVRLYQSGTLYSQNRELLELLSARYRSLIQYTPFEHSLQSKKGLDALEAIKDDLN